MVLKKMLKIIIKINLFIFLIVSPISLSASNNEFKLWVIDFKKRAINSGVSQKVVDVVLADVRFLPKVIEYDRYQPEFYEDTFTYIKKRTKKKS